MGDCQRALLALLALQHSTDNLAYVRAWDAVSPCANPTVRDQQRGYKHIMGVGAYRRVVTNSMQDGDDVRAMYARGACSLTDEKVVLGALSRSALLWYKVGKLLGRPPRH